MSVSLPYVGSWGARVFARGSDSLCLPAGGSPEVRQLILLNILPKFPDKPRTEKQNRCCAPPEDLTTDRVEQCPHQKRKALVQDPRYYRHVPVKLVANPLGTVTSTKGS